MHWFFWVCFGLILVKATAHRRAEIHLSPGGGADPDVIDMGVGGALASMSIAYLLLWSSGLRELGPVPGIDRPAPSLGGQGTWIQVCLVALVWVGTVALCASLARSGWLSLFRSGAEPSVPSAQALMSWVSRYASLMLAVIALAVLYLV
jgi:hypothetical protein